MVLEGIDLASHQGDYRYPTNPDFAIIKASGGHAYRNEYLATQVANARAKGIIVGFYHYMFEPTSGGGDVKREVENFIEACRPHVQEGTTFWLDVEEFPKTVGYTGNLGDWLIAFCEAVERAYGCVCGIYCATWYLVPTGLNKDKRLTKYPFWMASWQDALPPRSAMAPWDHLTLWQYNADVIDKDWFAGTREEFLALGKPGVTVKEPIDTGADEVKEPASGEFDAYQNSKGETIFVWNAGGTAVETVGINAVDLGVSVKNAKGETYDRSLQSNVSQKWEGPR